jgi:hydroxypyruvate reductase
VPAPAEILVELFRETVRRLDPAALIEAELADAGGSYELVAVGKAAVPMALGAARALGDRLTGGLVVAPEPAELPAGLRLMVGAHPVPDARSERAGRALLATAAGCRADRLLALVSGGASALAAVPAPGLTLAEKAARVAEVMAAGAPIGAINALRTRLSAIKGGRLAAACPVPVTTLVISDVVGDDLAVVGSGPTICDPPRPGDRARLVAGVGRLVDTAAEVAGERGLPVAVRDRAVTGDVAEVCAAVTGDLGRGLALWGGEPTIALPPDPGVGGRAHQLALLCARAVAGRSDATVLVAGSDGIDGVTGAAGAVVDGATWAAVRAAGVDPERALARCDAGTALAAAGAQLVTGRTGVNHADLIAALRQ